MTPEKIDYVSILNDMKAKRAVLDASIAALEAALASGTLGQGVEGLSSGGNGGVPNAQAVPMDLPKGAFLGKNMTDAVVLFLTAVRQRKTVKEIAAALLEGGIVSTSDNFVGVVQAKMQQLHARGQVLKFADGWGLAEWYPAGFRAASTEKAGKVGKKKTKRKAASTAKQKAAPVKTESSAETPPQPAAKVNLDSKIEVILASDRTKIFSASEIATALGSPVGAVNFALGRMGRKGKAEKASGGYKSFSGKVQEMPLAG